MVGGVRSLVTLFLGLPATEQDLTLDRENTIAPTTHEEIGDGSTEEAVLTKYPQPTDHHPKNLGIFTKSKSQPSAGPNQPDP